MPKFKMLILWTVWTSFIKLGTLIPKSIDYKYNYVIILEAMVYLQREKVTYKGYYTKECLETPALTLLHAVTVLLHSHVYL